MLYRVFQDYVLNPFLMSSGVEIHPILVLFGVLAGEKLGGIPGMFFSVPIMAILKVVLSNLSRAYTERELSVVGLSTGTVRSTRQVMSSCCAAVPTK